MMVSVKSIVLAPINGAVYVVKLPFVLMWMLVCGLCTCVYGVLCAILSFPINCVRRVRNRVKLLWTWTKTSARKCLPWKTSNTAIAIGTQTFVYTEEESDDHEQLALPPPSERDIYTSHKTTFRRSRGSERRQRQKKLVSILLKVLLEPNSPSDSGEENERAACSPDLDEGERAARLITDLLKLSRSSGSKSASSKGAVQPEDLEALRQRAKDKELLQALIAELDQLDVDPATLLHRTKRKKKSPKVSPLHSARLNPKQDHPQKEKEEEEEEKKVLDEEEEDEDEFDENGSVSSCGEITPDPLSEGSELIEETRRNYHGGLSPVQESPEYQSGSQESMNYTQLESDLNSALSMLNSEMKELQADQEVLEKFETQITRTVVETREGGRERGSAAAGGGGGGTGSSDASFEDAREEFSCVPKVAPSLGLKSGHDRRELAAARKTRPPTRKTDGQYPIKPPTDGADKDTAAAAGGRGEISDDDDEEQYSSCSEGSEYSEGEEEGELERSGNRSKQTKRLPPGAVQVLPPLSDQFKLLSPKSRQVPTTSDDTNSSSAIADMSTSTSSSAVADLYSRVQKRTPKSSVSGDADKTSGSTDVSPAIARRRGSSVSASSDVDGETGEKRSWVIQSTNPPWIEMRSRSNSAATDKSTPSTPTIPPRSFNNRSAPSTPAVPPRSSANSAPTTPTVPLRMPDAPILPRKAPLPGPSANAPQPSEGLKMDETYDVLPPRRLVKPPASQRVYRDDIYESIPSQHQYLHQVVAAQQQQQEMHQSLTSREGSRPGSLTEPSPPLPPRNPAEKKIKRALSLGSVDEEKIREKARHASERMSASPRESRTRDKHRSESSSSRKHHHSHSSDREGGDSRSRHSSSRHSSSDRSHRHHHHHHHRHRSRSRERSDERKSRSKHHHSRDGHHHHHHRSTSGDRSASRERHSSSSSRHRSHSSERRHRHCTSDHSRDRSRERSHSRERSSRHSMSSDHHRSRSSTKREHSREKTPPKPSKETISPWRLFISPALSRKPKESSKEKEKKSSKSSLKKSKSSEASSSSSSKKGSKSSPPRDTIPKSSSANSFRSSLSSTGSRESIV